MTEKRQTNSVVKTTSYAYNLDGSLATITYPSGRVITYTSSAAARPLSAVDTANGINYATSALYSPPGAFSSLQNGSGIVSTFYLNNRLEPCRISVKTTGTAPTQCSDTAHLGNILDFTYDYNLSVANNGNVKQITNNLNSVRTQSFTYDEMNRVKTALTQGTTGALCWGLDYSYDVYANLTTVALDPARPSCTWTTLNAGISTSNRITNTGFSYDAAGNVLADGSFNYTWDAESQLKTAAGVTYTYDGDGRRVQKSNGKLYWYGAGGEVVAESDAAGNLTDEYVFFGGKRIARRNVSSGNIYYYFADHLGSSRVVLQSGQSTPCYDADFDPFGGEHIVTNTCPQNYKFTGKERDAESGLDDFEARYYSSQFGRFHSADWSAIPVPVPYADLGNPQTLNLYTYVTNNPLNLTDPTGHIATGLVGSSEGMLINFRMRPGDSAEGCVFSFCSGNGAVTIFELTVNGEGVGLYFGTEAAGRGYIANQQAQPSLTVSLAPGAKNDSGLSFPSGTGVGPVTAEGQGWYWNVLLTATLPQGTDASGYEIQQTAKTKVSEVTDDGKKFTRSISRKETVAPNGVWATTKGNKIYAVDGPGIRNVGPNNSFVKSANVKMQFTSWIAQNNHRVSSVVKWSVNIVVRNGQLDSAASWARLE